MGGAFFFSSSPNSAPLVTARDLELPPARLFQVGLCCTISLKKHMCRLILAVGLLFFSFLGWPPWSRRIGVASMLGFWPLRLKASAQEGDTLKSAE